MMRVWPVNSRHPLSTYEWWIFVNHFWNLMEGLENNSVQSDEDSFPSDHAACTVWTISRHQKTVSHLLIYHRQQAHYLLSSCYCTLSFNDICYFNSTPHSFLFNFSRERDEEPFTLGYWLPFAQTVAGMLSSDSASRGLFFRLC